MTGSGTSAQAPDCGCPVTEQQISATGQKLGHVKIKVIAVRDAATNALHWALSEFPSDANLQIDDAALRRRVSREIEKIKQAQPVCGIGDGVACQFDKRLQDSLNDLNLSFLPSALETPPTEANAQPLDCSLCFLYTPSPAPPQSGLEIQIKTAAGAVGTNRTCVTLRAANPAGGLSDALQAVPVQLAFAPLDVTNARRTLKNDAAAEQRVREELLKVAAHAFELARPKLLLDEAGKAQIEPDQAQSAVKEIEAALAQTYDLRQAGSGISWSLLSANVQACGLVDPSADSLCARRCGTQPAWIVTVSGLQLLRSVGINVLRDVSEDEYAGTDTARALRRKRERVAASLREQIRRDPNFFQARPTAIATGAALEKDRARLSQLKGVAGVAEIQSDPRLSLGALQKGKFTKRPGLVYILQRPELEESTLSFKVAGSYSVEEKFIASAGIDEFNMLHWGEQIAFSHAQGPEVLRTQLQFSRPFANKSGKRGWRIEGVGLRAQYWRDNNQRLGNVTAEELAAREAGSRAHFVFGFDSFARTDYQLADLLDEKRPRTHWTLHGQTALEYRDVNIPEDDRLLTITKLSRRLLPDARTQATNLVLTLSGAMSHDLREHNGLGTLTLGFDTTLQRGIGWLGADYRYGKAAFSGRGELFFGPETAHEFFVRHTQGIARSGDRTPVFELFRLGGPNNLRGIEEGEIIGRRLTYGQSEVGVNALALWQMLRRNPTTKESPNSSAKEETRAEAPAFDFSHLYVKGLVDWARISDPTSFAQTNAAGLKRQAQGYGVAVELRNLAAGEGMQKIHLTIGYARSPQSVLHRSGTIFTSVSLNY